LTKDIFTHIVAAADYENAKDTTTMVDAAVGDTFYLKSNYVVFESVNPKPKVDMADEGKLAVAANLKISDLYGMDEKASPLFFIDQQNNNEITTHPYSNESLGLTIDVMKINPDTRQFTFAVSQKELKNDFVIMKAIIFPYINLVWLGGYIDFLWLINEHVAAESKNEIDCLIAYNFAFLFLSIWSAKTSAVIASTIGTALGTTQGSWRPLASSDIASPWSLIVS
jgi:hypothetical protein